MAVLRKIEGGLATFLLRYHEIAGPSCCNPEENAHPMDIMDSALADEVIPGCAEKIYRVQVGSSSDPQQASRYPDPGPDGRVGR
jgi:hypothetical protein